jgi:type IV pilus assembly protein PilY1
MCKTTFLKRVARRGKWGVSALSIALTLLSAHTAQALTLSQVPLFLSQPVTPIMMLNMSNDHQLFFKAYDDYSDLDADGNADTTYMNDYDYYGYFDSLKCYSYTGGVFVPAGLASNHYCTGSNWSGNFLNWASMTRVDTVRKILYGGKRHVDSASRTVLERAYLPRDAHSFAKYYNGTDLNKLTPFNVTVGQAKTKDTGITICNTTAPSDTDKESQEVVDPPLMQVAEGNYSLWASSAGAQCVWGKGKSNNVVTKSHIYAYNHSPSKSDQGVIREDYNVRVEVCNAAHINQTNNEGCAVYKSGALKPTGLLQEYGGDGSIHFGLMTGSYKKNKSGGTLRKNVGSLADEIDSNNGTFKTPQGEGLGIIGTLDAIRIARFSYGENSYGDHDACTWGLSSFSDGNCSNWGNPQSELFLESLRYLAGKSANFAADDSSYIPGLTKVTWADPIDPKKNYCAPLGVLQFNASTSSYDSDQLSGFSDIQMDKTLTEATDHVGTKEGIDNKKFFVGETGSNTDQLCTAKTVSKLSGVKGTCPDAPRLGGSYQIAGMAYQAHLKGIAKNRETVQTFGVSLAPAVPRVDIPVPGGSSISLQPACRNSSVGGNCAIVDFKVIEQDHTGANHTGRLYVNWEDSEQGGDFDQDMWGIIEYDVDNSEAKITTQVMAQSASFKMGFGYVISGTNKDGFHAHSGLNYFSYNNPITGALTCTSYGANQCNCSNSWNSSCDDENYSAATTQTFGIGGSGAKPLKQPLYYAAKWGGFPTETATGDPKTEPSGEPENYFFATDPRELQQSLQEAFDKYIKGVGAATAVATNSTRFSGEDIAYQAKFNTESWSGDLLASPIEEESLGENKWSAAQMLPAPNARNIWTHNREKAVKFEWDNLHPEQQTTLNGNDNLGPERVRWTRGEEITGFNKKREASGVLGDIVNSTPTFAGTQDYAFDRSAANGANSYASFAESKTVKTVFVGANDGMLHAFDANTGVERFAYIPSSVYSQLKARTESNYGGLFSPHQYSVDGQIFVGDAYVNGSWKTILVAALGAGGKGLFALDVTNATDLSETRVLFEYNQDNAPEMGNITGNPIIAPMPDGSWAIISGNGYNSKDGEARLVIIPLDGTYTPTYISTGKMGDNGLSEPAISVGGSFLSRYAYAGDLQGNMYKFNLKTKSLEYVLYTATDDNGKAQPITASPVLGINPYRKTASGQTSTMVYFGTGRYLINKDLSNTDIQSFYGIADTGKAVTQSELFVKDITNQGSGTRDLYEGDGPKGDEIDWSAKAGWMLDWDEVAGERVVDKPILSYDRLVFPTVIPTDNPCDYGGNSWIMALTGVGGLYPDYNPLPPVDGGDGDDGDGDSPPGVETDKIVKLTDPTKDGQPCGGNPFIIQQNSDGTTEYICSGEPDIVDGRQSWRQLQ